MDLNNEDAALLVSAAVYATWSSGMHRMADLDVLIASMGHLKVASRNELRWTHFSGGGEETVSFYLPKPFLTSLELRLAQLSNINNSSLNDLVVTTNSSRLGPTQNDFRRLRSVLIQQSSDCQIDKIGMTLSRRDFVLLAVACDERLMMWSQIPFWSDNIQIEPLRNWIQNVWWDVVVSQHYKCFPHGTTTIPSEFKAVLARCLVDMCTAWIEGQSRVRESLLIYGVGRFSSSDFIRVHRILTEAK